MIFDDDGSVWFRQSWLDTAMRCGERGRNAIVRPEWDQAYGDSALIGTAMHHAAEQNLNGTISDDEVAQAAFEKALQLCETETVKWTKWSTPGELAAHAERCAVGWLEGIKPSVELGGQTEVEFKVPLFTRPNGRVVGIKGQIDYIEPSGLPWDWKTAARAYNQREKQLSAVQPTVYTTAIVKGGLASVDVPLTFRYGITIRGERQAKPQIVEVTRYASHIDWLIDNLNTYVTMGERLGLDVPWPRDDDHYLCSATWCPWWSACKGARLTPEQVSWKPNN
jgi:hypothetical protein